MALLECPECGADVSDQASECPSCGCPFETGVSWSELLLVVTASVILFGVLSFFAAGSTVLAVAYLTLGVATVGMVAAGAFIKAAPPWVHWVSDQALARRSWTVGLLLAVIGAGAGLSLIHI